MDPQTIAGVALVLSTAGYAAWGTRYEDTPLADRPAPLRWSGQAFEGTRLALRYVFTGHATPRARRTQKPAPVRPGRPDYDQIFRLEIADRIWREVNDPGGYDPYAGEITNDPEARRTPLSADGFRQVVRPPAREIMAHHVKTKHGGRS
jgi:hypothetical protein